MRANEFIKEDFSDDLGNIYALHPGAAESEKIALKITDMDEDDFSEAWNQLPTPYQQEFGYDLPLWELEYLKEYPHMTVEQVTFDQYVELVTNYIRSEDVLGSTLTRMKSGNLTEFLDTGNNGGGEDPKVLSLNEFADIVEQYLGRGYTRQNRKQPKQVSVKFVPKDKSRPGAILYSFVDPKRGEYDIANLIMVDYVDGMGKGRNNKFGAVKTITNAVKMAELIFGKQLNEFLDDRKRDDDDEISKIVSTADRLLKQGYRVDLHVVGAMGRVYRADFDQTGFTPNGALAFKRKTRTFMRPFLIDDDEKYDFEMVAPKHYKIVDSFTKNDQG